MAIQERIVKPKGKRQHKEYRARVSYKKRDGSYSQKNGSWYTKKSDAENDELRFKLEVDNDEVKASISIKEVGLSYINYTTTTDNNTARTRKEKEYILEHFILGYFKETKDINTITSLDIMKWLNSDLMSYRTFTNAKGEQKREKYKATYKNKVYGFLIAIFHHGAIFYNVRNNAYEKVKKFSVPHDEKPNMIIYDEKEFLHFFDALDGYNYRSQESWLVVRANGDEDIIKYVLGETYKCFFWTLYRTGMRIGEILSLQWSKLFLMDVSTNVTDIPHISISEQYKRQEGFTALKNDGSTRTISIDWITYNMLMALKMLYAQLEGFSDNWFIFGGTQPVAKKTIENIKKAVIERNGMRYLRIHDFRHSHASYLIDHGGVNCIVAVSRRLGHSSVEMTLKKYTHLMPSGEESMVNLINSRA